MAGEDLLTQMFDAWREDIDSVPFPQVSDPTGTVKVPRMREPLPIEMHRGRRGQGTHADV
ncbi:MAG: hypothetical protein JWQ81_4450 [Amycolatopsis sp.]|jgi:hypothetical protein|uniref:hypothetical protein n=1 Tax=Amycolatopsis sp. TaxID=37632 RepID=UPI00262A4BD1|nr:hypothetical protein [Amycolatopsis sp.]MCU1683711.1 hypothetical protein [Amycolatopsis sp.]